MIEVVLANNILLSLTLSLSFKPFLMDVMTNRLGITKQTMTVAIQWHKGIIRHASSIICNVPIFYQCISRFIKRKQFETLCHSSWLSEQYWYTLKCYIFWRECMQYYNCFCNDTKINAMIWVYENSNACIDVYRRRTHRK